MQGLNAKCFSTAKTRALVAVAMLDDDCSHPRISDPDLIGQHLLKTLSPKHVAKADLNSAQSFALSEALKTYFIIKGIGKGKTFHTAPERERVSIWWKLRHTNTFTSILAKMHWFLGTLDR